MGQEEIAHLLRLDMHLPEFLQNSRIAVFITGIDHHPATLDVFENVVKKFPLREGKFPGKRKSP